MPSLGIRGANPIWLMVNLWGKLFDDTYYMWVLENQIPYIPAPVFHDPDLSVEWTDPIQFLGNGTLPNDVFFEPNMVYRLEFRQNNGLAPPSQSDPLIYLVENYVPGQGGSTPVDTVATLSSNQITNPQFALINFTSPYTYTGTAASLPIAGKINVAPGWFLNLAGTGSVTITQVPLNNAETNPSNAPYALHIIASGWTAGSVFLSQRFEQNGMLWANQFVASAITASLGPNELPQNISAQLVDSNSAVLGTVLPLSPVVPEFNEFTGYAQLPATTNPNIPPAAYIEYQLMLPSNIDIFVTSIQLVVEDVPAEPSFTQDSINRQIDHTFNYYKDPLLFKPISSYLIGWDFPLNPVQFVQTTPLNTGAGNKSFYVWDQTIIFQSANGGIAVTRDASGAITLTAQTGCQMGMVQYLQQSVARELLTNRLSVNVAAVSSVAHKATISLWYTNNGSAPDITPGNYNSVVTSLGATGLPSVASGWTQVPRLLGDAVFTTTPSGSTKFNHYGFNEWDMNGISGVASATFFAIVVGTETYALNESLTVQSISLVPGDVPTIPAPQAIDEVLRECEHYYEQSYANGVPTGTVTTVNSLFLEMNALSAIGSAVADSFASPFDIVYRSKKRVVPNFLVWSIDGTANSVDASLNYALTVTNAFTNVHGPIALATDWNLSNGQKSISFAPKSVTSMTHVTNSSSSSAYSSAGIQFHYSADARIGVV